MDYALWIAEFLNLKITNGDSENDNKNPSI